MDLPQRFCFLPNFFGRWGMYKCWFLRVRANTCLSLLVSFISWYRSKTRWDRDFGFSPYHSLEKEYLVFCNKISCHWLRGLSTNKGEKGANLPKIRYFTAIGLSSVKMDADRHRHAVYHNKHWWRAFQLCQHQWLRMTSNPRNKGY